MAVDHSAAAPLPDSDLIRLCADRKLATPELHEANDYYGHAALLKDYIGWPRDRSLKVAIEHGTGFGDYFWVGDLRTAMPSFLCASPARAAAYERATGRSAFAIGSLLHYALRRRGRVPAVTPHRKRLIAFPAHSTHRVGAEFDVDWFIERLRREGRDFDDVLVCVYWRDVQRGLHRRFAAQGFDCVSAGHIFDLDFLPRLVAILDQGTAAVTNEPGTSLLYAALAGLPVWIERQDIRYVAPRDVLDTDAPDFPDRPIVNELMTLFAERRDDLSDRQRAFVATHAGSDSVRTPAAMAALFEDAETRFRREVGARRRIALRLRPHRWRYLLQRVRRP